MITSADSLDRLFEDAAGAATAPLWTMMRAMVPPHPVPKAVPHVWRYSELRPLLGRAGNLISADQAERRVLMLINPALEPPQTTDSLFAGLQMILPGETAPAHRHTAFALRFIVEGSRGFTAVGGEKVMMERGDMILTPSWEFHDHGHEGDGEMIWLDGLDLPIWQAFPVNFAEGYYEARYPSQLASGPSRLKYPWSEMLALLDQGDQSFAAVAYDLRDSKGPVSRTLGASAERIDAGTKSPPRQETASVVYHVVEGSGTTKIDIAKVDIAKVDIAKVDIAKVDIAKVDIAKVDIAKKVDIANEGERELRWERGDTFAIPAWMPYQHDAKEKTYLFRFDDRPLMEALGAYRSSALEFPEADLREHPPRSARVQLGGLSFLARTIDKTKAKLQGTLGAYKVSPGLSGYFLEWLGIGEDAFTAAVRDLRDDERILEWVRARSAERFDEVNEKISSRRIRDEAHRAEFLKRYAWLNERPDLWNFFDILDYDDERSFSRR